MHNYLNIIVIVEETDKEILGSIYTTSVDSDDLINSVITNLTKMADSFPSQPSQHSSFIHNLRKQHHYHPSPSSFSNMIPVDTFSNNNDILKGKLTSNNLYTSGYVAGESSLIIGQNGRFFSHYI